MSRCALEGWITQDAARRLFKGTGRNFDRLAESATQTGFEPVPLEADISLGIVNRLRLRRRMTISPFKLEGGNSPLFFVLYVADFPIL